MSSRSTTANIPINIEEAVKLYRSNFIRYENVFLPDRFKNLADRIKSMDVRADDIWVCSFPRSGTLLTQEMVWCIMNDMESDLIKNRIQQRFPFLELTSLTGDFKNVKEIYESNRIQDSISYVNALLSPRFIKTHLPYKLLPEKLKMGETSAKVIYVKRNSRDVCVSFYHHRKLMEGFQGSFDLFCKLFLNNAVPYAPYWDHHLGYWESRHHNKNILFITYEDMISDMKSVILKTSDFLGQEISDSKMDLMIKHLSFDEMKKNPAVNSDSLINSIIKTYPERKGGEIIRCGKVGQWDELMTPEIIQQFDVLDKKMYDSP